MKLLKLFIRTGVCGQHLANVGRFSISSVLGAEDKKDERANASTSSSTSTTVASSAEKMFNAQANGDSLNKKMFKDVKGDFLADEFKGLSGVSKCVINDILGPEPNYNTLKPDTYNTFKYDQKFYLKNGGILPEVRVAYETWGKLNNDKSNAILLFTGLSANSHAKSSEVN